MRKEKGKEKKKKKKGVRKRVRERGKRTNKTKQRINGHILWENNLIKRLPWGFELFQMKQEKRTGWR
jgi:hypothetical protein